MKPSSPARSKHILSGPRIALIVLIASTALLAGLETLLRLKSPAFGKIAPDPKYIRFLIGASGPFFRVKNIGGEPYLAQVPEEGVVGPQMFPFKKSPGKHRLIVLGESNAHLLGTALREIISTSPRPERFEVFNCGLGGSSLEQTERVFNEVLAYSPDVIIVVFGHNLMYHHKFLKPLPYLLGRMALKSRLLSFLVFRWRSIADPPTMGLPGRLRAWEDFLRNAASRCRSRKTRLLVCTLQGNLWYPPGSSGQETDALPFLETLYLWNTSRKSAAIAALKNLAAQREIAAWHFQLADWLYQDGSYAAAFQQLKYAADRDPHGNRVHSAANIITRRLAQEEGFELLDLETHFNRQGDHGIPGWDIFSDHCHPFDSLGPARTCLSRLKTLGWMGKDLDLNWDVRSQTSAPQPAGRAAWLVENAGHYADPLAKGLSYWISSALIRGQSLDVQEIENAIHQAREPASHAGIPPKSVVFCQAAEGFARAAKWPEAFYLNEQAVRSARSWEDPLIQRALFHLRLNRPGEALASFEKALEIAPKNAITRFFFQRLKKDGQERPSF